MLRIISVLVLIYLWNSIFLIMSGSESSLLHMFNYDQLRESLWSWRQMIVSWLSLVVDQAPRVVGIYLLVLILLLFFVKRLRRSYTKILSWYVFEVDRMIYLFSHALQHNKDHIHNIDQTLSLLTVHKNELLTQSSPSYVWWYELLLKDMLYLQELLHTQIFTETHQQAIERTHWFLERLSLLYNAVIVLLNVLTLWLVSLFVRRLPS